MIQTCYFKMVRQTLTPTLLFHFKLLLIAAGITPPSSSSGEIRHTDNRPLFKKSKSVLLMSAITFKIKPLFIIF